MDLWVRETRLFKYGSGADFNFSALRGENEKLSGGGRSSGLMSFLKIGAHAAGAIKSGGTTRRAAKMVVGDHPDIEAYIDWKVKEEQSNWVQPCLAYWMMRLMAMREGKSQGPTKLRTGLRRS